MPKPTKVRIFFSVLSVTFGFALTALLIYQNNFAISNANTFNASVKNIGMQMLSTQEHGFILPFEVVSVLLLAAMIGCIVIAMKSKSEQQ